jgi:hypothetical protein
MGPIFLFFFEIFLLFFFSNKYFILRKSKKIKTEKVVITFLCIKFLVNKINN